MQRLPSDNKHKQAGVCQAQFFLKFKLCICVQLSMKWDGRGGQIISGLEKGAQLSSRLHQQIFREKTNPNKLAEDGADTKGSALFNSYQNPVPKLWTS